jgi:hypothetical protein
VTAPSRETRTDAGAKTTVFARIWRQLPFFGSSPSFPSSPDW